MARGEQNTEFRWRLWANVVIGCVVLSVLIFTCRAVRRFAVTDPRFALAGPDERSAGLSMDGLVYASRERLLAHFAPDFGRSVFLLPVAERRRRLLAIDWVEDAYIARILPNRVNVRIKERVPVAFLNLPVPGGRGSRVMLVDGEGVLLDPPAQSRFRFPVLTGVTGEQTEVERQHRVHAMLRLLDDLGPMAKDISEVNAAMPENLMIVTQIQGRAVELVMGNRNFSPRLRNFLEHYPEIRRRSGNVKAFDLRLDDRITAGNQAP